MTTVFQWWLDTVWTTALPTFRIKRYPLSTTVKAPISARAIKTTRSHLTFFLFDIVLLHLLYYTFIYQITTPLYGRGSDDTRFKHGIPCWFGKLVARSYPCRHWNVFTLRCWHRLSLPESPRTIVTVTIDPEILLGNGRSITTAIAADTLLFESRNTVQII